MIDELILKGEWFLPGENNKIYGELNFNSDEGGILKLNGGFNQVKKRHLFTELDYEIILGNCSNSNLVTLINCQVYKFESNNNQELVESNYTIEFILQGIHNSNFSEIVFNKISAQIFNLDEWINLNGFNFNRSNKNRGFELKYNIPNPIEFQIRDGVNAKFEFLSNVDGSSSRKMSISQKVFFEISYSKKVSLIHLLKELFVFEQFLRLVMNKDTYSQRILLVDNDYKSEFPFKNIPKRINLFRKYYSSKLNVKPIKHHEMILSYDDVSSNFNNYIKKWYRQFELLEPSINLLIYQLRSNTNGIENYFLNITQSSETFHSRVLNRPRMDRQLYKLMKDEILKDVDEKYHEWLNSQFSFGNHLTLHDRLLELCDKYSNDFLDSIIIDKETFIKQIKHSRNYYTHYSKSKSKNILFGIELVKLTKKLQLLLTCALLMEIGITSEKLSERLKNSGHFSII